MIIGLLSSTSLSLVTVNSSVSSFYIINLGVSDFLMGLYMLIIGAVDAHYRGRYIMYADSWRASPLCQFAGMIAMISSEVMYKNRRTWLGDWLVGPWLPMSHDIAFQMKNSCCCFTWDEGFRSIFRSRIQIQFQRDSHRNTWKKSVINNCTLMTWYIFCRYQCSY